MFALVDTLFAEPSTQRIDFNDLGRPILNVTVPANSVIPYAAWLAEQDPNPLGEALIVRSGACRDLRLHGLATPVGRGKRGGGRRAAIKRTHHP